VTACHTSPFKKAQKQREFSDGLVRHFDASKVPFAWNSTHSLDPY